MWWLACGENTHFIRHGLNISPTPPPFGHSHMYDFHLSKHVLGNKQGNFPSLVPSPPHHSPSFLFLSPACGPDPPIPTESSGNVWG